MPAQQRILGISCDYHDAAAALVVDGIVVGAAAEERFSRVKHDASLPVGAVTWLADEFDLRAEPLTAVAFYAKPFTAAHRILTTHARAGPIAAPSLRRALSMWGRSKLWIDFRVSKLLASLDVTAPAMIYAEHHQSHAASAFYPSPFDRAAIVTLDGVGEWTSASVGSGNGHRIRLLEEAVFPDSLGMFYSAMTSFCGFDVNDGEYKLMGLAPYGTPRFEQALRDRVIQVVDDGSVRLDQRWFRYQRGESMCSPRLAEVLGGPARAATGELTQREADIARSVQAIVEDVVLRTGRHAHELTGESNLCLAGGVALNCVANRRLIEEGPFDEVWVQPAAGDDGGSLGAALWATHQVMGTPRRVAGGDSMSAGFLGPSFPTSAPGTWLGDESFPCAEHPDDETLSRDVASRIESGQIVGWFQGRMEFGPRALGNRSILADPRQAETARVINSRVKGREGFRPFAPSVTQEAVDRWFDGPTSAFMTTTTMVRSWSPPSPGADSSSSSDSIDSFADRLAAVESDLAACTHVDGSARVQVVRSEANPRFHALIEQFGERTGTAVLLNTSFNLRDEPIVASPSEALDCALRAKLDALVVGRCVVDLGSTVGP